MGLLRTQIRKTLSSFFLLSAIGWIGGCRGGYLERPWQIGDEDWTVAARTLERQYRIAADSIALPAAPLWTFETGAGVSAQPLVVDSTVIVANLKGTVYFLSRETGEERRSIDLGKPIASSPAVSDSMMFVGLSSGSQQLVALHLLQGSIAWRIDCGPIDASPSLVGDVLIIPTLSGRILGIDAETGEERWAFSPTSSRMRKPFRAAPAIKDSIAFVPCDDGTLYALSIADGSLRWASVVGGSLFTSPLIVGERVMVASTTGEVACFDVRTGKAHWSGSVGGDAYSNLATDGRQLFVGAASRDVHAFDILTGVERWRVQGSGPIACAVAFADAVIVGTLDRTLISYLARDGDERWRMEGEGRFRVAPILSHGVFIIVTDDRRVTAYKVP